MLVRMPQNLPDLPETERLRTPAFQMNVVNNQPLYPGLDLGS